MLVIHAREDSDYLLHRQDGARRQPYMVPFWFNRTFGSTQAKCPPTTRKASCISGDPTYRTRKCSCKSLSSFFIAQTHSCIPCAHQPREVSELGLRVLSLNGETLQLTAPFFVRTQRCRAASGLIISSASPFASAIIVSTAQVTIDDLTFSMVSKVAPSMYILFPLHSSSRISPINCFVVPLIAFTTRL